MSLFYGVLCIAFAVLIFGATLLGARNPRRPRWAGDGVVANLLAPLVVGSASLGVCSLIQFLARLGSTPPSAREWGLSAVTLVAALLLLKLMRIRTRLQAYDAAEAGGQVISPVFQVSAPAEAPEPPVKPQPGLRKAA